MPASEVQGPLGVQFNLSSHIPGTHSVACSGAEDRLLVPSRARSQPIGESSQGPSYGRRTQSESALNILAPMPVARPPLVADNAAPDPPASAPSPVPTEIITPDLSQEEIVTEIQRSGIKVRDFAHEKSVPVEQRAPELFDPILAWHVYESILDNTNPQRSTLNGRSLRRLLALGWVSEEADGNRWQQKDREALEKFDSNPLYPWRAFALEKPRKADLAEVAAWRFRCLNAEQLAPQFVSRGISRLTAAFRGSRNVVARYQKRSHVHGATETDPEGDPQISPRLKKRRLSPCAEPATLSSDSCTSLAQGRSHE